MSRPGIHCVETQYLVFMIVMYPSSGYIIFFSKIKILSINTINSCISGHTEDKRDLINACGV